jgi:hypothetical protein
VPEAEQRKTGRLSVQNFTVYSKYIVQFAVLKTGLFDSHRNSKESQNRIFDISFHPALTLSRAKAPSINRISIGPWTSSPSGPITFQQNLDRLSRYDQIRSNPHLSLPLSPLLPASQPTFDFPEDVSKHPTQRQFKNGLNSAAYSPTCFSVCSVSGTSRRVSQNPDTNTSAWLGLGCRSNGIPATGRWPGQRIRPTGCCASWRYEGRPSIWAREKDSCILHA